MSVVCFNSVLCLAPCIGDPGQSWILDSTLWVPNFRYWISVFVSWNLDSGFQSFLGFPDSLSCIFRFQNPGIRIPQAKFPGFSYMGRIVLLRFSLYWIKIVLGRRITCLPELHWACQLFLHFVTKLDELFTSETKCWLGKKDDPPS